MTKVQALVTVVVSKDKEIKSGKEGEIDAKDAQKLSKLGFVKIIGTDKGQTNGSPSGKGSQ